MIEGGVGRFLILGTHAGNSSSANLDRTGLYPSWSLELPATAPIIVCFGGCVAEDGRGGGQPQDPAEWPFPRRPPDPGGAERGTGPHGSGAGSILMLWSSVLSESALDLAQAGYKVQILPVLICVAVHKKLQILVYFLSFNPPWRLTGPQTGEQCAVLENKLMKRTVRLTAWLAPYPILRPPVRSQFCLLQTGGWAVVIFGRWGIYRRLSSQR